MSEEETQRDGFINARISVPKAVTRSLEWQELNRQKQAAYREQRRKRLEEVKQNGAK